MTLRFASNIPGSGLFQVRVDSINGPLLAEAGIGNTGGINSWTEINLNANSAGVNALVPNNRIHDLFLTANTPYEGELARIDWIRFNLPGSGGARPCFLLPARVVHPARQPRLIQPRAGNE